MNFRTYLLWKIEIKISEEKVVIAMSVDKWVSSNINIWILNIIKKNKEKLLIISRNGQKIIDCQSQYQVFLN